MVPVEDEYLLFKGGIELSLDLTQVVAVIRVTATFGSRSGCGWRVNISG
jgi:hypothetical protein